MYNLSGLFSLVLFLLSTTLFAESFADFKRVQSESFTQFKDKRDDEFSRYLQEQWQEYRNYTEIPLYTEPKPKSIISAQSNKPQPAGPFIRIRLKEIKKEEFTPFKVIGKREVAVSYFGSELGFNIDAKIKNAHYYPYTQKGIENFFTVVASSNYENTLNEIQEVCKSLALNDWGLYLLVEKIASKIYANEDEQHLFIWFMLNKLSYDVKVALANKHVLLLVHSVQTIYSTPRYKIGENYFYILKSDRVHNFKKIYTYTHRYPDANRVFDFSLKKIPHLNLDLKSKNLFFKEYGQEYSAQFQYNQNLIDFLATYPQVSYEVYFSAPIEQRTYHDIAKKLKQYIDGKKASVAIDFLLKFVQKAFIYEVDEEQFSKEKVMFAEETLVYNKSDCEDRAILFAYLVKNLLGISVIGVKYPDHMATALYIPMQGDSVKVGKRRYVIADPTYINATIGQSMPKYKSIKPQKFIVLK